MDVVMGQRLSIQLAAAQINQTLSRDDFIWAIGSLSGLYKVPFQPEILLEQYSPPYSTGTIIEAARALGFKVKLKSLPLKEVAESLSPVLVLVNNKPAANDDDIGGEQGDISLAFVSCVADNKVTLFQSQSNSPSEHDEETFLETYRGHAFLVAEGPEPLADPDAVEEQQTFGFKWFVPELMKHRNVWRDVLLASLFMQLLALGTPLFTQAIIDKVVVHQTKSTLIVIGLGMAIFMIFTSVLTWVRQYLVLHTGNRVDAVLASTVFQHLFKLPPRYFESRPTGVIAARLEGVENIREFIASAAVTLILDLPFLFIFVAIMFWYSIDLTVIVLTILSLVALVSLIVAPMIQKRLNEQFLLGARNQAFLTEYIAGIKTVKSLQMESRLNDRFSGYMADYMSSTFKTRQLSNTYNVTATTLEQAMTLLILIYGAYMVMEDPAFTIGMLIAFQMFASRLSQPMMRLVGLWQQFQQASLSVKRLGDVMNVPTEPYSLKPNRMTSGPGNIEFSRVSFRHSNEHPFLYQDLNLVVRPGTLNLIMGKSGSGKSTLIKLLQGYYRATDGQIRIDGTDIRYLASNELRRYFGVVPQETILFSGTVYDNLAAANPHATFEAIVSACKMADIHEVIENLPQGYQTKIGERGAGLSGGQKQRISIARALLKQPKILVFDEATSNLDAESAEKFALIVNNLRKRVSIIFIAHVVPKGLVVDERTVL